MTDAVKTSRAISGSAIVLAMFVFGIIATGLLWTYWYYHTAPFIPLQQAIAAEFPGASPRVDGGQRRMHRGTPAQLWVIVKVEFHPSEETAKARQAVARIEQLTREKLDLSSFETLTIRLFRGDPEKTIHSRDFTIGLKPATSAGVL